MVHDIFACCMVPKDRLRQHRGLQVTLYNVKEHHFKTYNVETKPVRLLHKQDVLIDIKLISTFHLSKIGW